MILCQQQTRHCSTRGLGCALEALSLSSSWCWVVTLYRDAAVLTPDQAWLNRWAEVDKQPGVWVFADGSWSCASIRPGMAEQSGVNLLCDCLPCAAAGVGGCCWGDAPEPAPDQVWLNR
jgi:hypothetical protein